MTLNGEAGRCGMREPRERWGFLLTVLMCLWIAGAPPALAQDSADATAAEHNWEFVVAPYIWIPAMTGSATVRGATTNIDTSVSDIFTSKKEHNM